MVTEPRAAAIGLAGVCLAAGAGTRLRPLTDGRPKALCPVLNRPLLDCALDRLDQLGLSGPAAVAVNAHHHAAQIVSHAEDRAHVAVEAPVALGTAGALGALRGWLDGRDVVVANADAYLAGADVGALLDGWDRRRIRLLVVAAATDTVLGPWEYAGLCALPAAAVARLAPAPSGLYEVCWRDALARGEVDLVAYPGTFIDCGTPADYLAANLHASRGQSVIGAGAVVDGRVTRSVLWSGAQVGADEWLVDCIRGDGHTVHATSAATVAGLRQP